MKIGLDFDGVITAQPKMFSDMSRIYLDNQHEVHIITGNRGTPDFMGKLESLGVVWSHFFSIADHLYLQGAKVTGYEENQPWFDETLWNRAKGEYCARNEISFHIDDSDLYGQYFTTPYLRYQKEFDSSKNTLKEVMVVVTELKAKLLAARSEAFKAGASPATSYIYQESVDLALLALDKCVEINNHKT